MFILLENKIFVREDIKQIFFEGGDIWISYREEASKDWILVKEIIRPNGTFEDLQNIFDILVGKEKCPNSNKCVHLKIEQESLGIYRRCSASGYKLCSDIFGTSICFSLYEEKESE